MPLGRPASAGDGKKSPQDRYAWSAVRHDEPKGGFYIHILAARARDNQRGHDHQNRRLSVLNDLALPIPLAGNG